MMGNGEILGLLYWLLRNMDYLCTAHGVVHIRIGWNRLVPDHPFFYVKKSRLIASLGIDATVSKEELYSWVIGANKILAY